MKRLLPIVFLLCATQVLAQSWPSRPVRVVVPLGAGGFADAILALDDSVPTGTYVDMCSKLPLVDPAKLEVPTIIMRGEFDGIASVEDLLEFFRRLPNADKQFAVMAGISHASFQQKNYLLVYHILHAFFTQPEPEYRA